VFFQEHDIGVWVSRVVPTGNGAMKGIQRGDQLAAINGSSSLHVTIEEVAQQISDGATDSVELTFLRYVGPMCPIPCVNKEEGFEISDSAVLPSIKQRTTEESPKSKRGSMTKTISLKFLASPKRSTQSPGSNSSPSQKMPPLASPEQNLDTPSLATHSVVSEDSLMPELSSPITTKKKMSLVKLLSFKKKS
jgi:hypothetical protein